MSPAQTASAAPGPKAEPKAMFVGLQAPPEEALEIEPEESRPLETDEKTEHSGQVDKYKGTCARAT
eukprot:3502891-Lingulodinium_polyedra.AAC.1